MLPNQFKRIEKSYQLKNLKRQLNELLILTVRKFKKLNVRMM